MSFSQNIRSVTIGGSVEPKGFGLDGYAYSFKPIPEPTVLPVICLGLTAWLCVKRHWQRRKTVLVGKTMEK
jgi:hypothetical protein